jgi:alkaline phosphatase
LDFKENTMHTSHKLRALVLSALLAAGAAQAAGEAKNIIFFLGDGMGPATVTASRIYRYGEDGKLNMERLERTARIRTYSNDAQTTDSAPSMSAYMTGVKMNNDVISMSADTKAVPPDSTNTVNNCARNGPNGQAAQTVLELAKASGKAVGAVTTTRVTHATPAATYAHICHRDLENDIAAQAVPAGAGYNTALGNGLDVLMGGGRKHFLPNSVSGGYRTDGRDLTAELKSAGYTVALDRAGFDAATAANTTKLVGLFTSSHMSYELDRDAAKEPSLAEMTAKAIDILAKNGNGYFLMVEGGRIDHALHETNAKRAFEDTIAFDEAIRTALAKVDLANTLVVVTADHDHTMIINGYGKRTGPTTASNAGILGLVKNVVSGQPEKDAEGRPYTNIGFGNGENRVSGPRAGVAELTEAVTAANNYHQEAAVRMGAGSETHGGGDVMLMATGAGALANGIKGTVVNTRVFAWLKSAYGF